MRHSYPEIEVNGATWDADGFVRPAALPARTKVDYSKFKIASRLLIGLVCLGLCAAYVAWSLSRGDGMGSFSVVGSGMLAAVGAWFTVASVNHLFIRRPLVTVDAEGMAFLRRAPLPWRDVGSVQLSVVRSESGRSSRYLKVTPLTGGGPFEVDLSQTTSEPDALFAVLRSYVAAYRDAHGLPTGPG